MDDWLDADEKEPAWARLVVSRRLLLLAIAGLLLAAGLILERPAAGNAAPATLAVLSSRVFDYGKDPAIAFDPAMSRLLVFNEAGQTWLLKGSQRIKMRPSASPSARQAAVASWDPTSKNVVLFGGRAGVRYLRDTWTWNGLNWSEVNRGRPAPPGGSLAMGFDPSRETVVLIVTPPGKDQTPEVWTWDGVRWDQPGATAGVSITQPSTSVGSSIAGQRR